MTVSAVQYTAQTVPSSIIYANVEKTIFENMLKKWTPQITPAKIQRPKKWLTQKEVADTYGLRMRTLEQLRKQGVGFPTKVVKGVVYYNRHAIEKHYAMIQFQASKEPVALPCTLNARIDFSQRKNRKRIVS